MQLMLPRFVVLDTATIAKASTDYWSADPARRRKARFLIGRLTDEGVHICLSVTHLLELVRHHNQSIVQERIGFLHGLPLVACPKPYVPSPLIGGMLDLLLHELHVVVHGSMRGWEAIINSVRATIWRTGQGRDFFSNDDLWDLLRIFARQQQELEQYVASVDRTDADSVGSLTVGQARRLGVRSIDERHAYVPQFAARMLTQLKDHGDSRVGSPDYVAATFASDMFRNAGAVDVPDEGPVKWLLDCNGVPEDVITDEMTVDQVGQLGVYVRQLALLSGYLRPSAEVTIHDVPLDSLPSYYLGYRLAALQRRAHRVSGSDFGDRHIAAMLLYADSVEVDKRTHEYLTQLQRGCPGLAGVMKSFFRAPDYSRVPDLRVS